MKSAKCDRPPHNQDQIPKRSNFENDRQLMTSFRQIEAKGGNARKSIGPITEEGTAETVIGALEDAEDYKAFEATIIANYDAQSAVTMAFRADHRVIEIRDFANTHRDAIQRLVSPQPACDLSVP
jgi:hypothetical protein